MEEREGSRGANKVVLVIGIGDDDELDVEDCCGEWVGVRLERCRPARSLPACVMNRTGAKSEAGCNESGGCAGCAGVGYIPQIGGSCNSGRALYEREKIRNGE